MAETEISKKVAKRVMSHMNGDHASSLLAYSWSLLDTPDAVHTSIVGLDADGCELLILLGNGKEVQKRLQFESPVSDKTVREVFIQLHHKAMKPFIPKTLVAFGGLVGLWLLLPLVSFELNVTKVIPPLHALLRILRDSLNAGVISVFYLQLTFFIAIGAHVLEAAVAGYLLSTKLRVKWQDVAVWMIFVFAVGFPVLERIITLYLADGKRARLTKADKKD